MINITNILMNERNEKYKSFSEKLVPDTNYKILGVNVPTIKRIAKTLALSKNDNELLNFFCSKHLYYEEYLLHGLLIGYLKKHNLNKIVEHIENFLPYIDNWAICDSTVMNLKIIGKNPDYFLSYIIKWIYNEHFYVKRFAIVSLMSYYLDDNFDSNIINLVSKIKSENYYVNMACAWFFSVALVKQYDQAIDILKKGLLSNFIHNKTIQKAIESFRIPQTTKDYLKSLKRKNNNEV